MSWWVSLRDDDETCCKVPLFSEGGTYSVGGSDEAELSVTYNYGREFAFGSLDGMTGEKSIPLLQEAVARLGTVRVPDYWDPTPGNVGHACNLLLSWARLHPKAKWHVW